MEDFLVRTFWQTGCLAAKKYVDAKEIFKK